jgi:hypothetical protein
MEVTAGAAALISIFDGARVQFVRISRGITTKTRISDESVIDSLTFEIGHFRNDQ